MCQASTHRLTAHDLQEIVEPVTAEENQSGTQQIVHNVPPPLCATRRGKNFNGRMHTGSLVYCMPGMDTLTLPISFIPLKFASSNLPITLIVDFATYRI
jgi:hypothetical protein